MIDLSHYPDVLKAEDVATVLRISRHTAYELMHSRGFPTLRIGEKRMMVPKDKFVEWLDHQTDHHYD